MDLLTVSGARAHARSAHLCVLAVALGALWGGSPAALAFVPGMWAIVWLAPTRVHAWFFACLYHFVACRCLWAGAIRYFAMSSLEAFVLLAGGAAIASLPYMLVWAPWHKPAGAASRACRVLLATTGTVLPPCAAFAVASPLPAAGLWFPRAGWIGLLGLVIAAGWLRAPTRTETQRRWQRMTLGMAAAYVVASLSAPASAASMVAVDTHFDPSGGVFDFARQWDVAHAALRSARRETAQTLVLPESVAGLWQPIMHRVWSPWDEQLRQQGRVAIVGATLENDDSSLQGAAVFLGATRAIYRQRVPVPFAMWKPWRRAGSFSFDFGGPGVVHTAAGPLGVLLCWEVGSPWAVLQSVAQGATAFVALANVAWLRGTSAARAQQQALAGWAALFGLPAVMAKNE